MHQATELVMQFFYISLCAKVVYKTHQVTELLRDEKKDPAGNSFSSHQVTELVLRFFFSFQAEAFSFIWAKQQAAELVLQVI